ncbi:hypothetical protein Salat_0872600 [Sesamum alatum]|uniref:Uncharacterized protein n=1 Tax=Sesamum alatum TaxID=300844 RepID=A0AAE2CQS7_9LAMI|nr:hypothetical protein Salat_0872600 [Sesamum alatum]
MDRPQALAALGPVLFSSEWLDGFPHTTVRHLPRYSLDHCPLLISMQTAARSGLSFFRFQNMWTRHLDFLPTVRANWTFPTEFTSIAQFRAKLRRLKQCLKHWNKFVFGDIFQSLKQAEEAIGRAKRLYNADPSNTHLIELNRLTAQLQHALAIEEDFCRQKSACKWVLEGERKTRYFHSLVKKKRARTMISSITVNGGGTVRADAEIRASGAEFFCSLLTAGDTTSCPVAEAIIPHLVSEEAGNKLKGQEATMDQCKLVARMPLQLTHTLLFQIML